VPAVHRRRACVSRRALQDNLTAGDANDAGDHAERPGRALEDGALLDVRLDVELGQRPALNTCAAAGEATLLVAERDDSERTPATSSCASCSPRLPPTRFAPGPPPIA